MFFVRTAGERDLASISALLETTWHATYDALYGAGKVAEITASWHTVEALRPRIGRLDSEFVVADDGETIAGMAFAAAGSEDSKLVTLHQLYVLPAHQRRGVGSDLLVEIEQSFPDATRMRLEVEIANTAAMRFYEAKGFSARGDGATEIVGSHTLKSQIMEKPLG